MRKPIEITIFIGDVMGWSRNEKGKWVNRIITYSEGNGVKYYLNGKKVGFIKEK